MSKTSEGYVPHPMSAHPHYESQADGIRSLMADRRTSIRVPELQPMAAAFTDGAKDLLSVDRTKRRLLDIKECAGPAPFVGDPLWESGYYYWYAAVDDLGRHVAGDATLDIFYDYKG